MGLVLFLVFGFVVGLLARAIMPGRQHMGILMTAGLGIAGSLLGGFIGSLITHSAVFELHAAGIIGSILGALAILAVFMRVSHGRHSIV